MKEEYSTRDDLFFSIDITYNQNKYPINFNDPSDYFVNTLYLLYQLYSSNTIFDDKEISIIKRMVSNTGFTPEAISGNITLKNIKVWEKFADFLYYGTENRNIVLIKQSLRGLHC